MSRYIPKHAENAVIWHPAPDDICVCGHFYGEHSEVNGGDYFNNEIVWACTHGDCGCYDFRYDMMGTHFNACVEEATWD